jgi:hypothetical protein
MVTKPVRQLGAIDPAGGEIEHETLLFLYGRSDLGAVKDQKGLHGGVPQALVAVQERVPLNQGDAQRRGLLDERGIQVDSAERGFGLGDGRFKRGEVADAGAARRPRRA